MKAQEAEQWANKLVNYIDSVKYALIVRSERLESVEIAKNTPLNDIKSKDKDAYIIFPLAAAKPFNQNDAKRLAKKKNIVMVSGRYEGIDERVIETYANEVFSVGDYILTGGELPSMIMADAISRNVDGVLGNMDSLTDESYNPNEDAKISLEAPSFTKPVEFKGLSVPSELLKGNHANIRNLKSKLSKYKTQYFRP